MSTPASPGAADSPGTPRGAEQLDELAHVFDFARDGDDERPAAYLDGGLPVDLIDAAGNTFVMLAADNGRPSTLRLLADPHRLNDRGQSPRAGVVFSAETDIVRTPLAAGADPAGSPNALDTARMFEQTALIALLEGAA